METNLKKYGSYTWVFTVASGVTNNENVAWKKLRIEAPICKNFTPLVLSTDLSSNLKLVSNG